MRKLVLAVVFTAAIALTAFSADAFPGIPQNPVQTPAEVIQVAGGCGPGWHRGPRGVCRRNWARGPRCWWRRTPWGPRRVCR